MKRNVFTALIATLFIMMIGFAGQASAAELPAGFIAKHGDKLAYVVTAEAMKLVKAEFAKFQGPSSMWKIGEKDMEKSKNGNFYRLFATGAPEKRWNVQTAPNRWMPYDLTGLKKTGKLGSVSVPEDAVIPNEEGNGMDFSGKVIEVDAQTWAAIQ